MILHEQFSAHAAHAFRIKDRHLKRYIENSKGSLTNFSESLLKEGWCSRDELGQLISEEFNVSYVNLHDTLIDYGLLQLLNQKASHPFKIIPLYVMGDHVTVASAHDLTAKELNELELIFGKRVNRVFSFEDEIDTYIKIGSSNQEHIAKSVEEFVLSNLVNSGVKGQINTEKLIQSNQVVEICDALIRLAIRERSSDIHLEPKKQELLVRYRIDGKLQDLLHLPEEVIPAVTSRYKILAKADISEHRRSQDGRFSFDFAGNKIDIRASFLPTTYGDTIVLRLLKFDTLSSARKLVAMGFTKKLLQDLQSTLKTQSGMLFVTGPTGSGKTTTLYGIIDFIKSPQINIITIEDPIEYEIPDITQVAVDPKVDRTFPNVLRAIMRQDPDVILIGEIRDLETAQIATSAALTGHAVLTTLHTNNAVQAVTRMIDMGVHHFVIAPSIIGVLNQRLVRKICENCKTAYKPNLEDVKPFFSDVNADNIPILYKGSGCVLCHQTGYRNRIPIHEFLRVNDEMRECILRNGTYNELYQLAFKSGYRDLRYDGLTKVLKGFTTLDELINITSRYEEE